MAGICENGHRSATDDYCDVCGVPVHPAPSVGPAPRAVTSTTQKCPNCGASNPADALFCEACGYDYTTGTLPRSDVAGMLGLRRDPSAAEALPIGAGVAAAVAAPTVTATPSYPGLSSTTPVAVVSPLDLDDPAVAVAAPTAIVEEAPAAPPAEPQTSEEPSNEPVPALTEPAPAAPAAPAGTTPLDEEEPTRGRPAPRRESYVAEIWIDPDWYEVQETDEPMPSVALPTTVVLGLDNLIGRASTSRNIHPEVDCGIDSGVSRRQSRLSTDATRWYVEDLGSANGTFVGPASGPLPTTPIQGRYELGPDDRIYVGAWTRIVVRKASKDEVDSLS
jgi:hypothetical protein